MIRSPGFFYAEHERDKEKGARGKAAATH